MDTSTEFYLKCLQATTADQWHTVGSREPGGFALQVKVGDNYYRCLKGGEVVAEHMQPYQVAYAYSMLMTQEAQND